MAWSDLIEKLDEILQGIGLKEAPELFSVHLLPKTIIDQSYCIWSEGMKPNTEYTPLGDRTYPINTVRISVGFDLGQNNPTYRNNAMTIVETIISRVIHPVNKSDRTRQIFFIDVTTELFTEGGFWFVADIRLNVEYELFYSPTI